MSYLQALTPFRLSVLTGLLLLFVSERLAVAAEPLDPAQIKAILKTAAVEEEGFIDRTVAMVGAGTLPRDMFETCFLWARRKPRHRFQYFKAALTVRAAEIGISL